jgi:hypothetical protein
MPVQTTYTDAGIAFEGLIGDGYNDVVTAEVETAAGIHYGRAVSRGTDKDKQVIIGGDGTFFGVSCRNHENPNSSDPTKYEIADLYDVISVMRDGYVWALVATGASAGAAVHYTDADGVIDTGAASTGETAVPGETVTDCANNSLVLIRVHQ